MGLPVSFAPLFGVWVFDPPLGAAHPNLATYTGPRTLSSGATPQEGLLPTNLQVRSGTVRLTVTFEVKFGTFLVRGQGQGEGMPERPAGYRVADSA